MAYIPLNMDDLDAGKPTKQEIFQRIHDNQEHFDDAISLLQGTSKVDIFNVKFTGKVDQYTTFEMNARCPIFRAPLSASIVNVVITLLTTSTSGNLQMFIDRSVDDGVNWTPILTTEVVLSGTTVGSKSGAVTFTDPDGQAFDQNDLLRLRFTGVQSGQGNFHVSVYGELS